MLLVGRKRLARMKNLLVLAALVALSLLVSPQRASCQNCPAYKCHSSSECLGGCVCVGRRHDIGQCVVGKPLSEVR
jgi:hypothetical protein